jgi:heme-binding protein
MGLSADQAVGPGIAQNDARGGNPPYPGITPRLIAGAIALTLAMTVGCSSNSHNIEAAPLPAAANSWTAFSSNPQVVQILASSCFDCHSEAGTAAWYVKIAPSYWWSGSARENLNFTAWKDYDEHRRSEEIQAIGRVVNRGEMPPWDYTVFHPAAELSNQQKDLVSEWALSHVEALPAH